MTNEEHQQDTNCRNRIMNKQIVKETELQKGILGTSSTGTPQNKKEGVVIQGQHKASLEKPSTECNVI